MLSNWHQEDNNGQQWSNPKPHSLPTLNGQQEHANCNDIYEHAWQEDVQEIGSFPPPQLQTESHIRVGLNAACIVQNISLDTKFFEDPLVVFNCKCIITLAAQINHIYIQTIVAPWAKFELTVLSVVWEECHIQRTKNCQDGWEQEFHKSCVVDLHTKELDDLSYVLHRGTSNRRSRKNVRLS